MYRYSGLDLLLINVKFFSSDFPNMFKTWGRIRIQIDIKAMMIHNNSATKLQKCRIGDEINNTVCCFSKYSWTVEVPKVSRAILASYGI